MASDDASRAMQALNGTDFGGRPLKVNEAQERERSGDAAAARDDFENGVRWPICLKGSEP